VDLLTGTMVLLGVWLTGSAAAAALLGRGIRLRDEREPERG
jgi:hypothetical protein